MRSSSKCFTVSAEKLSAETVKHFDEQRKMYRRVYPGKELSPALKVHDSPSGKDIKDGEKAKQRRR